MQTLASHHEESRPTLGIINNPREHRCPSLRLGEAAQLREHLCWPKVQGAEPEMWIPVLFLLLEYKMGGKSPRPTGFHFLDSAVWIKICLPYYVRVPRRVKWGRYIWKCLENNPKLSLQIFCNDSEWSCCHLHASVISFLTISWNLLTANTPVTSVAVLSLAMTRYFSVTNDLSRKPAPQLLMKIGAFENHGSNRFLHLLECDWTHERKAGQKLCCVFRCKKLSP